MKKIGIFLCIVLFMCSVISVHALTSFYYGYGNYVNSAPVKPTTGLNFYVEYSAVAKYGSTPFNVAFTWNGDYTPKVNAVAQYPLSATTYPSYFPIFVDYNLPNGYLAETYFYSAAGTKLNGVYSVPQNETSIYRCSIGLTSNQNLFNGSSVDSNTFLKKTIAHEIGHTFLLVHPATNASSVMHQGAPYQYRSATVTSEDKQNIATKWGY